MTDKRLSELNEEQRRIDEARAERETLLADPEFQRIRGLYQDLQAALDALDEAGERPADSDGYALYIVGKSFSLDSRGISENDEVWKRHMRKERT